MNNLYNDDISVSFSENSSILSESETSSDLSEESEANSFIASNDEGNNCKNIRVAIGRGNKGIEEKVRESKIVREFHLNFRIFRNRQLNFLHNNLLKLIKMQK